MGEVSLLKQSTDYNLLLHTSERERELFCVYENNCGYLKLQGFTYNFVFSSAQ